MLLTARTAAGTGRGGVSATGPLSWRGTLTVHQGKAKENRWLLRDKCSNFSFTVKWKFGNITDMATAVGVWDTNADEAAKIARKISGPSGVTDVISAVAQPVLMQFQSWRRQCQSCQICEGMNENFIKNQWCMGHYWCCTDYVRDTADAACVLVSGHWADSESADT